MQGCSNFYFRVTVLPHQLQVILLTLHEQCQAI